MESCIRTSSSTNTRRHCFVEEDDGLASLSETKAGFSGNCPIVSRPINRSSLQRRSNSLRNLASLQAVAVSSPRRFSFDVEQQPHFLDSCFLCKKPLGDRDIFMYRGDTPFCSEECRQEQIEIDEAKEKSWNLSASMKALRKKDQRNSTSTNKTNQDCSFRTSTLAAA